MSETWIFMAIAWLAVELVGKLRKKGVFARAKSAAIWSTVVASLATVGQMRSDQSALLQFAVCLAMFGGVATVFYFARTRLSKAMQGG